MMTFVYRTQTMFGTLRLAVSALMMSLLVCGMAQGDDWVFYGGSVQGDVHDAALREWYSLNRFEPLSKEQANVLHYYDQDSVASNSPFPGGTVRVWVKSIFKKETKSYENAKAEIEKEERDKLKRELSVLDYARLFPMAVNRATKEIEIYLEINCDTNEFFIMEANTYDKTRARMTREVIPDKYFWSPIRPGTLMAVLTKKMCE